jgi:hypothetical protein
MPVVDAGLELSDHFFQCGSKSVIDSFRGHIRTRRHEVSRDPKRRTSFESALNEHAGLVDME